MPEPTKCIALGCDQGALENSNYCAEHLHSLRAKSDGRNQQQQQQQQQGGWGRQQQE